MACEAAPANDSTQPGSRPPVDVGRQLSYLDFLAQCLEEQGIAAEVDREATELIVPDAHQQEAVVAAMEGCRAQAREEGVFPEVELTREDLQRVYEQLVAAEDCLEQLGYSIQDPPSRDSFIESYEAGEEPWHPYLYLPDLSPTQIDELTVACPVEP